MSDVHSEGAAVAHAGGSLTLATRRRFGLAVAYLVLLSPWIIGGAIGALEPAVNSPLDWVDERFAPRAEYDRFSRAFGAADHLVISWPGCRLDAPEVDRFTEALRTREVFFADGDSLFSSVRSGRDFLVGSGVSGATGVPDSTGRMLGSAGSPALPHGFQGPDGFQGPHGFQGPDGATTAVVIHFQQAGLERRGTLVPLIRAAAVQFAETDSEALHMAGPIVDGYAVDRASQATMQRLAPISMLLSLCFCVVALDRLSAAAIVFVVSCLCQGLSLAAIHYGGAELTALLIVLPTLVQVLSIATGIHLLNYYREAIGQSHRQQAVRRAWLLGWQPCVLSATTTAIGFASLMVSGVVVVREFGGFAAIGVLVTLAVTLLLVPGLLGWSAGLWLPGWPRRKGATSSGAFATDMITAKGGRTHGEVARNVGGWQRLALWQQRWALWICGGALLLMVVLGSGVGRLEASVRAETLFGSQSRVMQDYRWLEQHVGPLVRIEALVTFAVEDRRTPLEKLAVTDALRELLEHQPYVRRGTGGRDFVGAPGMSSSSVLPGESMLAVLRDANYLAEVDSHELWRVTAHVSGTERLHYGELLSDLQQAIDRAIAGGELPAVEVRLTGLMPLVHEIQTQLLDDLFLSFLTAFVVIAAVMVLVQASLVGGLLTMVPNLFPALVLFGGLGWWDQPLDIGTIMTASVAMGIAVDDTLHFLTHFHREMRAGRGRLQAVQTALGQCGRAMLQTTLICGAGMGAFALSDFQPTARFSWMMIALLLAALVGDLVVLPAMLLSPLGRWLSPPGTPDMAGDAEAGPSSASISE